MSLHAVVELALHISSIRNVDLFQQGVYHVECRLFEKCGSQAHKDAVPHLLIPDDRGGHGELLPAAVLTGKVAFRSSSVFIRYCEEEADINTVALYRIECLVDADPSLMLELKLMWADKNDGCLTTEATPRTPHTLRPSEFSEVSCCQFRLSNVLSGLHAYCPATFDENHFCRVGIMVHSTLVDFRLRLPSGVHNDTGQRSSGLLGDVLIELARGIMQTQTWPVSDTEIPTIVETVAEQQQVEAIRMGPSGEDEDSESPFHSVRSSNVVEAAVVTMMLSDAVSCVRNECLGRLAAARSSLCSFLLDLSKHQRLAQDDLQLLDIRELKLPDNESSVVAGQTANCFTSMDKKLVTSRPGGSDAGGQTNAVVAARKLVEDVSIVSAQVLEVWQLLLRAIPHRLADVTVMLYASWEKTLMQYFSQCFHSRMLPGSELSHPADKEIWLTHARIADGLRESGHCQHPRLHVIEDLSWVVPASIQTVFFEQRYGCTDGTCHQALAAAYRRGAIPRPPGSGMSPSRPLGCNASPRFLSHVAAGNAKRQSVHSFSSGATDQGLYFGMHVVVFVHGFQASSYDMRLIKNSIALLHPQNLYLLSTANENDTEASFEIMGERLAKEVKSFITEWCPGLSAEQCLGRLSFIAHSAGGLIVRSALPLLIDYRWRMYTFISFSSPHLGYMYSASSLINAGLWIAKRLSQSQCLEQLSFTDDPNLSNTFLVRLAEKPGLEYFKQVVLVSSKQDQYVPFESARIEMSETAECDPKFGTVYAKMVQSLLEPVKAEQVIRLDVDFHFPERNLDTMIGRTAHIQFLECHTMLRALVQTHSFLFE